MKKRSILSAVISAAVIFAGLVSGAGLFTAFADEAREPAADLSYAEHLFDSSFVHTIDVRITDSDWKDLQDHPTDKTKYCVDVVIDGETVSDVSFATKGNASLNSVASMRNTDRYSFKINFGKYVDGQTYRGLDKINLNNSYLDATYMKDYMTYEIFKAAGVPAQLTSYCVLSINGEELGLYLVIEDGDDSYLERTNEGKGTLYKPETYEDGGANAGGSRGGRSSSSSDSEGGASLNYIDDEVSSYPQIFDNNSTHASEKDQLQVIAALKGLSESEGIKLEEYLYTDEIIRYFAAHNYVLNYDSYTGAMRHNYYLYERAGRLAMLPWDYNEAFGAHGVSGPGTDATKVINSGIDSPLNNTTETARPMWAWIVENEEYLDQYHEVFRELVSGYFESGEFEAEALRVYEMIRPYVETDPSSFYTVSEFDAAYEMLVRFCEKRTQSIRKQLDGELATVTEQQDIAGRVDASDVEIAVMGVKKK